MDLTTILYGGSKVLLCMVMIFGAFLAFMQMNKGKVKTLFVGYLLFWALLLSVDIFNMISDAMSSADAPIPAPFLALATTITSQLVILFFLYNLLFTVKKSFKIIGVHIAVVAVVLGVIMCVDHAEVSQFFYITDSLNDAYDGITPQSIFCKALIVIMQFAFSAIALSVSNKLVAIYQGHIEKVESNAAYNILWIKAVSRTLFVITMAYIYLMVFITYTNAIVYYFILIVAYMYMISILIQHVTLVDVDEMYNKLGIKWSYKKMWYHEEVMPSKLCEMITPFNQIIEWIESDRPYVDSQFSFKEISAHFKDINYNDFDALIKSSKRLNFQSYIRECRIGYAIELMNQSGEKLLLKEIAFKVGFDSSAAFSRAFKAVKGVAASEWSATASR